MKHKMKFLVLGCVVLIAVTIINQCGWGTWRYKMVVVVETPEGIKTGFAVREVRAFTSVLPFVPISRTVSFDVTGEAVVVDLGERGVLFAIMDEDGSHGIVNEAFPLPRDPAERFKLREKYYKEKRYGDRKIVLNPEDYRGYPQLVMFTDLNDPSARKNVNYQKLDAFFGDGVTLKAIYIQMTDEPITEGIENLINKFGGSSGQYDRQRFQRRD